MARLFQVIENGQGVAKVITAATGIVSVNTTTIRGSLSQIYVKATTDTTTFDFKMTDKKNRIVKHYTDEEGLINDECGLPVEGVYTLTIENASNDEAFDIFMVIEE